MKFPTGTKNLDISCIPMEVKLDIIPQETDIGFVIENSLKMSVQCAVAEEKELLRKEKVRNC